MFTNALVRLPASTLAHGLTTAALGPPDLARALGQHRDYTEALRGLGLEVTVLDPDEDHPDSTFVEDAAVLLPGCAVITRPGAPSRRGETSGIEPVLRSRFATVERITAPGTLDGGDVMAAGRHAYIGLSARTNRAGAEQLIAILERHGMSGSTVPLGRMLHLKSGVAYLENGTVAVTGELAHAEAFRGFRRILIPSGESYAANCLWINGSVLVAAGFPRTRELIEEAGYPTVELHVSEFRKLDGGLSCLSLRW